MNFSYAKSLLVMAIALTSLSAGGASAETADEAQIRALEGRLIVAVAAKDTDAVMKLYVGDDRIFVFDAIPPRQYVGVAAWRKDIQGFFDIFAGPVKAEISDLSIAASGDMAYSHSIQRFTGKLAKGGAFDTTLRLTDVYRKIDGQWLIVHEHVSVPVDFTTGKGDFASKP